MNGRVNFEMVEKAVIQYTISKGFLLVPALLSILWQNGE